ncbi:shikimate dehydrogenase [Alkalihalobacterium bogoriense]|uniref:shikimate dehydrogenase n=1 Tax=Alkalihalobacterium bogoriense TaxID=246272 RepID=UPI00047D6BE1|nr:shikimate dehydrogenase [Alkalihalobacterium bogoriense]
MGKLFGLLGNPVGHSLSPAMHNEMFTFLQLPHYYHAFNVEETQLEKAVAGIKALGIAGFNVTIPHKVAIMKYLDEIDDEAKKIGAVNTVVVEDGKLIGYNTDGRGYLESLLDVTGLTLQQKSVLVIGAGGAARAIVTVLVSHGVGDVTICNRTKEKANTLASETMTKSISIQDAEQQLATFDLIINTTSVGMSPKINEMPLSLEKMKEGTVVSDLIYNPLETKLLKEAKKKNALIVEGVGMFVGQGALAFEKWTGIQPDRNKMKERVLKELGGSLC